MNSTAPATSLSGRWTAPPSDARPTGGSEDRSLLGQVKAPTVKFLFLWALSWGVVGSVVAAGITFAFQRLDIVPVLMVSLLFSEVVGFTALLSARMVFPLLTRLPFAARLALQVLTLFSGTVFGSVAVVLFQPLFSLARLRMVATVVLVNAVLAVVVGIALHTYDSMRRQIQSSYEVLRKKEAMDRDMEIARDVQRELLPRVIPSIEGLQLSGVCIPAVGVGGDYYDFIPMGDGALGLVIADVSGKGVPAALLMAGIQASVRSLALPGSPPSDINERLNDILHQSTSASRYATFFFGRYECDRRTLTYSNAGHHPPLLVTEEGWSELTEGGLPIGILKGSTYDQDLKVLGSGNLLAFFTDGVVESPNLREEEFGKERLIKLLIQNRNENLDSVIRTVIDEVMEWSRGMPRHDDITLVLARVA